MELDSNSYQNQPHQEFYLQRPKTLINSAKNKDY
jgi:hypothetical protein